MKERLNQIREEALAAISEENADIEQIRIKYLGKKGELTAPLQVLHIKLKLDALSI